MNEEKIKLVLTDICGRLPYGVITKNCKNNFDVPAHLLPDVNGIKLLIAEYGLKPYLRPMSSMTGDEWIEWCNMCLADEKSWVIVYDRCKFVPTTNRADWLNSHHFDYRGLIPMGLALEAPKDMYNI